MRFAEFATLYRYEKTGELTGLTRVRSLTQDDCHMFCTPEQVESEFSLALNLIREVLPAIASRIIACASPCAVRPASTFKMMKSGPKQRLPCALPWTLTR